MRGLEGIAPRKKRCRRHYGVAHRMHFREGIDPDLKAVTSNWDGSKLCADRMNWVIGKVRCSSKSMMSSLLTDLKGAPVTASTKVSIDLFSASSKKDDMKTYVYLYSCSSDQAPEYCDAPCKSYDNHDCKTQPD